ncbi:MAG: S8 family serine peptidase [Alphaproteobacteria bacterium]|nr:S8 family serine peptidase [Alphaproteobacteria bacterium]
MSGPITVGILDSGVSDTAALPIQSGCRFVIGEGRSIERIDGVDDRIGHGTEVTRLIHAAVPDASLLHAQVFDARFMSAPMLVAAGLDWLVSQGADLINMSFGLGADRAILASACRAAAENGVLLIAAAPAQGEPCYPAAYPKVLAVTGDARCAPGEVTDLQGRQADFGVWCSSPERGGGPIGGASAAAAHFTGLAARFLQNQPGAGRDAVLAHFRATAVHIGPERRAASAR